MDSCSVALVSEGTDLEAGSLKLPAVSRPIDAKVGEAWDSVIQAKEKHMEHALTKKKWKRRYNPTLFGGDLFTMGYFGFQGVRAFAPHFKVGLFEPISGLIGGAINIGVGGYCLYEGIQELYNAWSILKQAGGDPKEQAAAKKKMEESWKFFWRCVCDCVGIAGVGCGMILLAVAELVGLVAITALFIAHPWIIPVFAMVMTIPLFWEIVRKQRIREKVVAELDLTSLKACKTKDEVKEFAQKFFQTLGLKSFDLKELSCKIEELQSKVQIKVALAIARLSRELDKGEVSKETIGDLEKELSVYQRYLRIRYAQQVVYFLGFVGGMLALAFPPLLGVVALILGLASAIALYLEFHPFYRNTPCVTAAIDLDEHGVCQCPTCKADKIQQEAI